MDIYSSTRRISSIIVLALGFIVVLSVSSSKIDRVGSGVGSAYTLSLDLCEWAPFYLRFALFTIVL